MVVADEDGGDVRVLGDELAGGVPRVGAPVTGDGFVSDAAGGRQFGAPPSDPCFCTEPAVGSADLVHGGVAEVQEVPGGQAGSECLVDPDQRGAVTAVFVGNDQMTLGVLKAFDEAGVHVPEQISVVGFDDTPEAAFYTPALTTIRMDFAEVGRQCFSQVLRFIRDQPLEPAEPVRPELVIRDSTAPPGH